MGEIEYIELKKALNKIGDMLVKEIKIQLERYNKNASHTLSDSIIFEIKEMGDDLMLDILGADYLTYVDQGRRAGRQPPTKPIEKWIGEKGLNIPQHERKGVAFAIARKIGRDGIPATNIIQKAIDIVMTDMKLQVSTAYNKDIQNYILNGLENNK